MDENGNVGISYYYNSDEIWSTYHLHLLRNNLVDFALAEDFEGSRQAHGAAEQRRPAER